MPSSERATTASTAAPSLIVDPGTLTLNATFNGAATTDLLTNGTLAVGALAHIQIQVTVTNVADQGGGLGVYNN